MSIKLSLPHVKNIIAPYILRVLILVFIITLVSCKKENHAKSTADEHKKVSSTKSSSKKEKGRTKNMNLVRRPVVAGAFYPADPGTIKEMIKEYMSDATVEEEKDELLGIIVPHAGYIYSGGVAAYSYKAIKDPNKIETVILMGPSHRAPFKGISVFPGGTYKTPLGDLTVDDDIASEFIDADDSIQYIEQAHAMEHSLEVQLPFIQTVFKDVKIVTAVFGSPDPDADKKFVEKAIEISKKKNVLFVASSDFSHYHSYDTAKKMDDIGIKSILKLSDNELMHKNYKRESELCGIHPVLTLIKIMNKLGGKKAKLLHYANSGDVSGDKSQVVGYASIAFYQSEKAAPSKPKESGEEKSEGESLNDNDRRELLKIARDTIYSYVKDKKKLKLDDVTNPKLMLTNGAFVTIEKNHNLRGCIGTFISDQPLYKTIIDMAISASTQDPRFPAVVPKELDDIELEISVLSPLKKIDDVNVIEVGTHGIYIVKGSYRGVLLPQVATDYGWNRTEFLEQTCRKAGLGKDAWKEGAEIFIFSADVFSEEKLKR